MRAVSSNEIAGQAKPETVSATPVKAWESTHAKKEERFFCVGKVEGKIVTVRFTYRNGKVRIFGAGHWRKGQRYYYE